MKGNEALAEAALRAGMQALLWLSHYTANGGDGVSGHSATELSGCGILQARVSLLR